MNRTFRIVLAAGVAFGAASVAQSVAPEALIQQAEGAWQHRDQPGQTLKAIRLWDAALKADPNHGELYTLLAKAAGRAYRHAPAGKDREHWADQARTYGALAVKVNPARPEAWAENGAALGQWAQAHKGVHSLSAVKEAVNSLEKAVTLNPRFAYGHMLLAQFYEQTPGWPVSVGDKKKALEHAQKAVEYGDTYAINHLTLAKLLLARGQKESAKLELRKALAVSPPPDAIPETRSDQADARELLKGL